MHKNTTKEKKNPVTFTTITCKKLRYILQGTEKSIIQPQVTNFLSIKFLVLPKINISSSLSFYELYIYIRVYSVQKAKAIFSATFVDKS